MQARKILSSIAIGIHRSPRVLFEHQKRRIADSKRSNSHKLQHFVSSPMDMQSVTNVPGIGPTYAGRLAHNGITHMSDSVKHKALMDYTLEIQGVRFVPGIGDVYADKLEAKGIIKACQLYMMLLLVNGNQEQFVGKLKELIGGGYDDHMIMAYNALMEWHRQRGSMS